MKLFIAYIKDKSTAIIAFALFAIVLAVTFALYQLPIEAVLYPTILNLIIGIVIIAVDFNRTMKNYRELDRLKSLTADMITSLPQISHVYDTGYNGVIHNLKAEVVSIESKTSEKYSDMMDYYSVWVHQIKTPIASMRLTLQNDDSALSQTILSDLSRIEQYVEMVLAYLRLDSESSDYVFKEYSVDEIIKKSVKKFSSEFIGRKLSLQFEPCDLTIVTDEKWFSFVIEQVLSNALKYTRKGSIKISMPQPSLLCIEDTGIGISEEDLPRVFEKGYTGGNGRTDSHASGLGLFLCKRICDNLSIGITAESKLNQGTRINLDLSQNKLRFE